MILNTVYHHPVTRPTLRQLLGHCFSRCLILFVLLSSAAGCTSTSGHSLTSKSGLNRTYQPTPTDAVVVIGIEGATQVEIAQGTTDKGTWRLSGGLRRLHNWRIVKPTDGFVVVQLDGASSNYMCGVFSFIVDGHFLSADRQSLPVFPVEPDTITYVGTLSFKHYVAGARTTVNIENKWNPDGAKRYMEAEYPHLAPRLQYRPVEFQKAGMHF